jgi:copper homeostasis protein (lipoprotein)
MTHRILFTAALCVSTIALAGCKPATDTSADSAQPATTAAAQPTDAAHPTDVTSEVDNSPAPDGLDVRAFAGSFKGTLPCADCPGIDASVELRADGTGTLSDHYQERTNDTAETGTWTVEENGKRIRFDPDSKAAQDRLYAVDSNDQITQLGGDGQPVAASGLDFSLKRTGAAK